MFQEQQGNAQAHTSRCEVGIYAAPAVGYLAVVLVVLALLVLLLRRVTLKPWICLNRTMYVCDNLWGRAISRR